MDQSTWTEQETTILASRAAFFRLPLGRLLAHLATLRTRRDSLFSSLDACRGENKGGVISGAYQPNPGPTKGAALANKPDRTGCRGKHAAHFSHPVAEKAAHTSAQPSHLELSLAMHTRATCSCHQSTGLSILSTSKMLAEEPLRLRPRRLLLGETCISSVMHVWL